MSIVHPSFLNTHWPSGRSTDCSRWSFNRFSRTLARIFLAIDNKEMTRWLSQTWGFPFLLNRWIIVASLNFWGMASFLHIMWDNFFCNWRTSCFVDLCRYCIWFWSLARWQGFYSFHCFRGGWELIKQRFTLHLWQLLIASSLIEDGRLRTPSKCSAYLFQNSFLVIQKTSSICT